MSLSKNLKYGEASSSKARKSGTSTQVKRWLSGGEKRRIKQGLELEKDAANPKQQRLCFKANHVKLDNKLHAPGEIESVLNATGPELKTCPDDSSKADELRQLRQLRVDIPQPAGPQQSSAASSISENNNDRDTEQLDKHEQQNQNLEQTPTGSAKISTTVFTEFEFEPKDMAFVAAFIFPRFDSSREEKLRFLKHHPVQPSGDIYKLPFDSSRIYSRKMPNEKIVRRNNISYSLSLNKVFCTTCACYSKDRDSAFVVGLTPQPKYIYQQLEIHENSSSHQLAVFGYTLATNSKDIKTRTNKSHCEEVITRWQVLRRIIDVILFIGRQGIAYRGKVESAFSLDDESQKNHGNFLALVLLLAKYDPVLTNHVQTCREKSETRKAKHGKSRGRGSLVTFLSKTTVNKLIQIGGKQVQTAIAREIKEAGKYSLEVDSCQDIGVVDQVALCARYVKDGVVQERLLALTPIRRTTGKGYYDLVKSVLESLGLSLSNVVSSAFDGASNMSGQYNGLQAIIKQDSPDMIYTHCYAHALNLVMSDSCTSCVQAQTLFGLLEKTAVFIGESYKRMSLWRETLQGATEGREMLRKLQKIGRTRWWAKDRALQAVLDEKRYVVLLKTLYTIAHCGDFEPKVAYEAQAFLETYVKFELVLTAFVFKRVFSLTTPVSKYLQTVKLDYFTASNMVISLREMITVELNNFDKVYDDARSFAESIQTNLDQASLGDEIEVQVDLPVKRIRKVRRMFDEKAVDESATIQEDRKKDFAIRVYKVILNTVYTQLESRFKANEGIMKDAAYLDPRNFKEIQKGKGLPIESLQSLSNLCHVERNALATELESFANSYKGISETLHDASVRVFDENIVLDDDEDADSNIDVDSELEENDNCNGSDNLCRKCIPCACKLLHTMNLHCSTYSNLFFAYTFLLTLSFTQVSCERSFSKLKILKTRLRSLIGQELLESLILLHAEYDMLGNFDYESVIDEFANSSDELARLLF